MLLWGCRHALVPFLRHWSREDLALGAAVADGADRLPDRAAALDRVHRVQRGAAAGGLFGTLPLAGHQIALMLAALTYMVPLGVAAAAAVLVGHAVGRGRPGGGAARGQRGAGVRVGFMSVTAIVLISFAPWLARAVHRGPGHPRRGRAS